MGKLGQVTGFEWDSGNLDKNWIKHGVSNAECEEIFLNAPLVVRADVDHSRIESRCLALGRTDDDRLLFVTFTIRNDKIRVIFAQDMANES